MLFAATFHASNLDQYPKNTIVSPIEAAHVGEAAEPAGQMRDRVADPRVAIKALTRLGTRVMTAVGCQPDIAAEIAEHLVDADLSGVYSHGIFRLDWCAERAAAGRFNPGAMPHMVQAERGADMVDGGNGLGIPAFRMATDHVIERARQGGMAAVGVSNVNHTGRIGAFAQRGAHAGCLTIMFSGGARADWRQIAPCSGARWTA